MISKLVDPVNWVHEPMWILKANVIQWPWTTSANFFFLETTRPIEAKFHEEPPSDGGGRNFVQMAQVTLPIWPPCPYVVKTLKILLWNPKADDIESWYVASGARVLSSLFKLTYFTTMSNFAPYAFVWEKVKTVDFSETIVVLWY